MESLQRASQDIAIIGDFHPYHGPLDAAASCQAHYLDGHVANEVGIKRRYSKGQLIFLSWQ
jgi:hypothetical protein